MNSTTTFAWAISTSFIYVILGTVIAVGGFYFYKKSKSKS
ncbi:LPXTG cell wall anchor domain-containing protein [Terrisporobacter petrolearius]|nr:LPXTG cell wall anchor domain-containing protein [Terrisporobacter petrolearius]MCC3866210.1 LPXTG cell wall anchor domain-containing protein [Terrisporobacter petrolearius]